MPVRAFVSVIVLFATSLVAQAQVAPITLESYALPAKAQLALGELAAQSDVLILGETHGTQEVPAVAAALLAPLTKLGYVALALEVPADQQGPLADWSTGKTATVPKFFAKPIEDGRGNIQVLSLIRTALSPPFRWQLICFDQSRLQADEFNASPMRRDADMASNLARERARLGQNAKVLAICGNLHARTANDASPNSSFKELWPSFAAALQSSHVEWRVRSVNVVPRSGAYFAMTWSADGGSPRGKVNTIRATRQIAEAEVHPLDGAPWNWELNLPHATPATFLATPDNAAYAAQPPADQYPLDKLSASGGGELSLARARGCVATVLVSMSVECPISNEYLPTLNRLTEKFKLQGVTLIAINPSAGETLSQMADHARQFKLKFSFLQDTGGKVARRLLWKVTPEVCVFDRVGKLVYRGRIDDRYQARDGAAGDTVAEKLVTGDLERALAEMVAGKPVSVSRTKASGCPIQWTADHKMAAP